MDLFSKSKDFFSQKAPFGLDTRLTDQNYTLSVRYKNNNIRHCNKTSEASQFRKSIDIPPWMDD